MTSPLARRCSLNLQNGNQLVCFGAAGELDDGLVGAMLSYHSPMSQTTKKCHWVPQAYLRSFATDPECRKIWRLSKRDEGGDPELKPIEKVAVQFYLYAPKDPVTGRPDDSMERKLCGLESFMGHPVWQALSHDYVDLASEPIRKMVSLIVAVMQFRNPAHFDMYKAMHQQLVETISVMGSIPTTFEHKGRTYGIDPDTWPAFRDSTQEDIKRAWLDDLGSAAWYAEELMKMRWVIVEAEQPTFVTSDNPVTLIHPSLRFRGLSDPETIVTFPLSPTRLLHMDHLHGEPANVYYSLIDNGAAQNLLIWRGANEHMFSSRHPDDVCRDFLSAEERISAASRVNETR